MAEVERRLPVVEWVEAAITANHTCAGELVPQNPAGLDKPGDEPASGLLARIREEK